MNPNIHIKNLTTHYGEKRILHDLNLSIRNNKITTIIGPSGCGKTTLLMTLSGLAKANPDFSMGGEILYKQQRFTYENIDKIVGMLGITFQQPSVFPFSIEKNMTFATRYLGMSNRECKEIAIEKLKEVNLWNEVKGNIKMKATKLSGGQQQRLCIARALTLCPDVLLLDEPCSSLDVKNIANIERMLLNFRKKYTLVLVTHNLSQAKRISDDVVFINNGKIVERGSSHDVFNTPKEKETEDYVADI